MSTTFKVDPARELLAKVSARGLHLLCASRGCYANKNSRMHNTRRGGGEQGGGVGSMLDDDTNAAATATIPPPAHHTHT